MIHEHRGDEEEPMTENQDESMSREALRIGSKIKELREKGRFTLHDMTAKTGLSRELLCQIETGEFIPPIATLMKLANAYGVGMAHFFKDEAGSEKIAVTRAHERTRITRRPHHHEGEVNYIYEALEIRKAAKHMEPFMVEFPVQDTSEMVFTSHEGEEFLHLLEGQLEFRSIDHVEVLNPGDSIYFESDVSHSFRCLGEKSAKAVVVVWGKQ
jgi:transcriptional regulator with XRE-family HTH domain